MARNDRMTVPIDSNRVSLDSQHLVGYWRQEFGCSEAALRDAVAAVGTQAADVRRQLDRARRVASMGPANSTARRASTVLPSNDPTNVAAGVLAVALCLVNALVWAFVADQTLVAIAWIAAAVFSFKVQVWSSRN